MVTPRRKDSKTVPVVDLSQYSHKIHSKVKIVVVGDGAVGKTCMLCRYANDEFNEDDYALTIFENINTVMQYEGAKIPVALWDTAGQEEFDRIRVMSYNNTDVFIICYSTVNPDSLSNIKTKWLPEIRQHSEAPVLLIGTKLDLLEDAKFVEEMEKTGTKCVTLDVSEALRREINADSVVQCSAKTRKGLDDVFTSAVRAVINSRKSKLEAELEAKAKKKRSKCLVM